MYFAVVAVVATGLAIAIFRVYRAPSPSTFAAIGLAMAVSYTVLSFCVALTFVWRPTQQLQGKWLVTVPALLTFGTLFITHLVRHRPNSNSIIGAVVLSALALYFLTLYIWLFTACLFGDCI
jgi:hypothetical protein